MSNITDGHAEAYERAIQELWNLGQVLGIPEMDRLPKAVMGMTNHAEALSRLKLSEEKKRAWFWYREGAHNFRTEGNGIQTIHELVRQDFEQFWRRYEGVTSDVIRMPSTAWSRLSVRQQEAVKKILVREWGETNTYCEDGMPMYFDEHGRLRQYELPVTEKGMHDHLVP